MERGRLMKCPLLLLVSDVVHNRCFLVGNGLDVLILALSKDCD